MSEAAKAQEPFPAARGYWRRTLGRFGRQPVTVLSGTILLGLLVAGGLAPVLAPKRGMVIDLGAHSVNQGPTLAGHVLGTDNLGRDELARLLWALRFTEETAILGGLAATLVAVVLGLTAGYFGGWRDAILMRVTDLVSGLPLLVLLIVAFAWLRPVTLWKGTAILALTIWPLAARVLRARAASLGAEDFVEAARASGASDLRIILRHLLPNATGVLIVGATAMVGQIVFVEATAEFFGFGIASTTRPTLGYLIGQAARGGLGPYNAFGVGWWVWAPPMIVLVLALVCLNLLGDGLDAALNPRVQGG